MKFLNWQFLQNSLQTWGIALLITLLSYGVLRFLKKIGVRRLAKFAGRTRTQLDDVIVLLLQKTSSLSLFVLALFFGSLVLSLSNTAHSAWNSVVVVILLLQTAVWGSAGINFWLETYKKTRLEKNASEVTTISAVGFIVKIILYSIIVLLCLDNLGINITALVTGLGVGGVAVALAVQNILSDLFASLSIVLDKPFVLGDFIIVDDFMGSVEHIGLKTTRVRSLSGEQLIFSNTDLLKSRIRNYKRMYERRVVFSIGVTYDTPYEKLEKIPALIREIVEAQEQVRFDRAHFKSYGDFSLNFEVVYWVRNPDYNVYMDIHQAINLALYKKFEDEGIAFAFPTQTIYLEPSDGSGKSLNASRT